MNKKAIFFSHANGFPANCYEEIFVDLRRDFSVGYIDTIGHDPNYPVTDNWDFLVDELLVAIQEQFQQPVIAVGHSLGGVLSYLAASKEPSLFESVVLLDSPVFGRIKSFLLYLIKQIGLIDNLVPGRNTLTRTRYWANENEAEEYLRTKRVFQRFDQSTITNYIKYGMIPHKDGLALKFDPAIEYQIYRTLPHTLPKYTRKIHCPVAVIYGNQSKTVKNFDLRAMAKNFDPLVVEAVQGGHLFPFENPKGTIQAIRHVLNRFNNDEN